jgi:hypothetical protein
MTYQVRYRPPKDRDGPSSERNGQARSNDVPDLAFDPSLLKSNTLSILML